MITVSGCTLAELEEAISSELMNLYCWLKANRPSRNVTKTEFVVIGARQKLLVKSYGELNIKLDNQPMMPES